jgi:hypothetical protein
MRILVQKFELSSNKYIMIMLTRHAYGQGYATFGKVRGNCSFAHLITYNSNFHHIYFGSID